MCMSALSDIDQQDCQTPIVFCTANKGGHNNWNKNGVTTFDVWEEILSFFNNIQISILKDKDFGKERVKTDL